MGSLLCGIEHDIERLRPRRPHILVDQKALTVGSHILGKQIG